MSILERTNDIHRPFRRPSCRLVHSYLSTLGILVESLCHILYILDSRLWRFRYLLGLIDIYIHTAGFCTYGGSKKEKKK